MYRRRHLLVVTVTLLTLTFHQWSGAMGDSTQAVVQIGRTAVRGLRSTAGGKAVQQFLGIRYAQAPVGDRRFQKPVAAELPRNVDATRYGARCPQVPLTKTGMSEDCLFLNVFVPERQHSSQPLPVLVFIHGGGFIMGTADFYEGDELAAVGEVVVVTLNYRLGPLGFLSTGDNSSPGNYGLWDQRMALRWVQKYIGYFSGDKDLVTLSGVSAGAASTSFLSLSRLSRHYFRQVAQLSGAAYNPWSLVSSDFALQAATRLGQHVGCISEKGNVSTQALVTCLRQQSVERLVHRIAVFYPNQVALSFVDYIWAPVVDRAMVDELDEAQAFPGPLMMGVVNNEGAMLMQWTVPRATPIAPDAGQLVTERTFYKQQFLPTLLKQELPNLVPQAYPARDNLHAETYTRPPFSTALDHLECAYYEGKNESNTDTVGEAEISEVFGDQAFLVGIVRSLRKFSGEQPSYFYYFDHQTSRPGVVGIRHVEDAVYLFGLNITLSRTYCHLDKHVTQADLQLQRDFRHVFINFLKTGNPTLPDRPSRWPVWPQYNSDKGAKYLSVSTEPRVLSHLKANKIAMWIEELPQILTSSGDVSAVGQQCGLPTSGAFGSYTILHLSRFCVQVLMAIFLLLCVCQ